MIAAVERLTGLHWKGQGPAFLVGLGHGGTHWVIATFYVLLPFITKDLGLTYAQAGALVTVFHISAFAANIGSGAVVDMTGRRVLVQFSALAIGAGALMATGLAQEIVWLAAAVIIIGITNNLWHPAAISFVSRRYPNNRGYALSIHGMGASLGDTLAPVATGGLLVWLSWNAVAMVNAVPVFAIAALILATLSRLDRPSENESRQGMSLAVYFSGIAGMVRDRAVLGLCAMTGFRSMTQQGLLVFLPLYLINELETSPWVMGLAMMGMQIGGLIAAPVAGAWSDRIGRRPVVLGGLTATTCIVVGLTVIRHEALFIAGVAMLGFVLFAVRPVIHSWLMDLTPPDMGGSATSLMFGVQSGLSAIVPVVGGILADGWGLPVVFYMLAATMLVANAMVYLLPNHEVPRGDAAI